MMARATIQQIHRPEELHSTELLSASYRTLLSLPSTARCIISGLGRTEAGMCPQRGVTRRTKPNVGNVTDLPHSESRVKLRCTVLVWGDTYISVE